MDHVVGHRKPLALLAVLAVDGVASRDRLMALLWPESDTVRARGSLKQAIHLLRRRLDAPHLLAGSAELRLNPACLESDVDRFRAALAAGELERALRLYGGPLLDGVHAGAGAELEQWRDARAAELARMHAEALAMLAQRASAAGDHASAAGWWTRLLQLDPADGAVTVALMRALDACGRRAAALEQARSHEALLREEWGLPPDGEVRALAAELGRAAVVAEVEAEAAPAVPAPEGTAARAPMVGQPTPRRVGITASAAATAGLVLLFLVGALEGGRRLAQPAIPAPQPVVPAFARRDSGGVAWDLYLRGRFHLRQHTVEGTRLAGEAFRSALAVDPTLAEAYTGLADIELNPSLEAPGPRFRRAKAAALQALAADSLLPQAHATLGWIALWLDRDPTAAEAHLRRAMELDPEYTQALNWYSALLLAQGRVEPSLRPIRRAYELTPNPANAAFVAARFLYLGRPAEARAYLESALASDSSLYLLHWGLGRVWVELGRFDEAVAEFSRPGVEYLGIYQGGYLGWAHARAGRRDEALRIARALEEKAAAGAYVAPTDLAVIYAALGEVETALDWVERFEADRGARVFLLADPVFDPLRGEPRLQELLARVTPVNAGG